MVFRNRAARLRIGHHRCDGELGETRELVPGLREPHTTTGEDRGAFRIAKPLERRGERGAARTGGRLRAIRSWKVDALFVGAREQHIDRQFEEDWTWAAGRRMPKRRSD